MSDSNSDEFAGLYDVFTADVDWSSIPELSFDSGEGHPDAQQEVPTANSEPHGLGSSASVPMQPNTPLSRHSSSNSDYFSDDLDEAFLAEVDALEQREASRASLAQATSREMSTHIGRPPPSNAGPATTSLSRQSTSRFFAERPSNHSNNSISTRPSSTSKRSLGSTADGTESSPRKSARRDPSYPSAIKKGTKEDVSKAQAKTHVLDVLEAFADEMTCPICCDLFAAAHVGNPCGHCFCGECGWAWISKNRRHPTCAICRGPLSGDTPMIPNYTLDSLVEKHIDALGMSGDKDWLRDGSKLKDWHGRKEKWKREFAKRAGKPKATSSGRALMQNAPLVEVLDVADGDWLVPDDEEDDESYHDGGTGESNELHFDVAEIVQDAISRALSGTAIQNETRAGEQSGSSRFRGGRGSGRRRRSNRA